MRAAAVALAVSLIAAAPARAAERLAYEPWPHAAISTGVGLLFAADLALRPTLAPTACTHCGGNAFDRGLSESLAWENHELATTFSDVGMALLPASAIAVGFARDGGGAGAIDGVVLLETVGIAFLATEALKYLVARERPMVVYLGRDDPKVAEDPADWYVSFPSGHASTTFATVAGAAAIADLRGHDATPIWLVGLPVAAGISYFRVAGLHHWTTDVLAGAALGTLVGVAVPRLLHGGGTDEDDDRAAGGIVRPIGVFQLGGTF